MLTNSTKLKLSTLKIPQEEKTLCPSGYEHVHVDYSGHVYTVPTLLRRPITTDDIFNNLSFVNRVTRPTLFSYSGQST